MKPKVSKSLKRQISNESTIRFHEWYVEVNIPGLQYVPDVFISERQISGNTVIYKDSTKSTETDCPLKIPRMDISIFSRQGALSTTCHIQVAYNLHSS